MLVTDIHHSVEKFPTTLQHFSFLLLIFIPSVRNSNTGSGVVGGLLLY